MRGGQCWNQETVQSNRKIKNVDMHHTQSTRPASSQWSAATQAGLPQAFLQGDTDRDIHGDPS